jgi:hypothetical protein
MSEEARSLIFGKPWANAFTFKSFKAADNKRNKLLEEGTHQVKVKRRPSGDFIVKTRSIDMPKGPKKRKRNSKKSTSVKG